LQLGAVAALAGCGAGDSAGDREGAALTDETRSIAPPADGRDGRPAASGPSVTTASSAEPPDRELVARAQLQPLNDSSVRGTVEFDGAAAEGVAIHVMLMGLEPGEHGFHVHENADCTSPGEHLNPDNASHGPPEQLAQGRHRGDLGNVTADAAGTVDETLQDRILADGDAYLGRALVVHAQRDDLASQPAGEAGDPVACGIIEPIGEAQAPEPSSGAGRPGG
jgi:Cu-Zn family superoxide dismutase